MKVTLVLAILAAFTVAQKGTGGAAPAAAGVTECLSACATTAFGVDATALSASNIPCAKEYAGPDGYKGKEFKSCICKDAKVAAAMSCQAKCQYGTMITMGFKSFCG